MRNKALGLSILASFLLAGCGQNAFLEHKSSGGSSKSSSSGNAVEKDKTKTNPSLSKPKEHSLHAQDINVGTIEEGVSILVPIIITNDGSYRIDDYRLSPCDVTSTERLDDGIIEPGDSETLYVFLRVYGEGDFSREVILYYKSKRQIKEKTIKITGKTTRNKVKEQSSLVLGISSQMNIDFGKLAVNSTSQIEVPLEVQNGGRGNIMISDLRFSKGSDFTLSKDSKKCTQGIESKCMLNVLYKPTQEGKSSDTLKISYISHNQEKTIKIKLSGEAIEKNVCANYQTKAILPKDKDLYGTKESRIELPYFETLTNSSETLYALANDDANKTYTHGDQVIRYVEDGQVILSYDLSKEKAQDIVEASFSSQMLKSADQGKAYEKTEILCLGNQKFCSGLRFIDSQYSKHINTNYEMINSQFSQILVNQKNEQMISKMKFYTHDTSISFEKLFEDKNQKILKEMSGESAFSIIIADDIKLAKLPYLTVKYKKILDTNNSCK